MKKLLSSVSMFLALALAACSSATGGPADDDPDLNPSSNSGKSSSSVAKSSSSDSEDSSSSEAESSSSAEMDLDLVGVPGQTFTRVNTEVTVSPFQILATEVTQTMYAEFFELPEQKEYGNIKPVTNVTWYDAVLYCNAVSRHYGLDTAYTYSSVGVKNVLLDLEVNVEANAIRLPTEAEWEAAARAGTSSKYYWGTAEAKYYANYAGTGAGKISDVSAYKPNAYGLYDMAGNVEEWVNDWYSAYPTDKKLTDPVGPKSTDAKTKVVRGGSFNSSAKDIASDARDYGDPLTAKFNRGFRIVKK